MSFFGKIWGGVKVIGRAADRVTDLTEPFIKFIPEPAATVLRTIVMVEGLAKGEKQGPIKKEMVMKLVTLSFPKINQEKLATNVDKLVEILNDLNEEQ